MASTSAKRTRAALGGGIQLEIRFEIPASAPDTSSRPTPTPPDSGAGRGGDNHLRREVNRLVGCVVGQSGQDYPSTWVMAYHGLFRSTGVHVIAEAARAGRRDQLGFAEERGLLPALIEVLGGMLTSDKYSPAD